MDATLTEEEALLAETAARLAADLSPAPGDPDGTDPGRAWRALAGSGLPTMRAEPGPGGASTVDAVLCAEAFGRVASPAPLVGPLLAVELLRLADPDGEPLAEMVAGRARLTVALRPGLDDLARAGEPDAVAFDALGATAAVALDRPAGTVAPVRVDLGRPVDRSADLSRPLVRLATVDEREGGTGAVAPVMPGAAEVLDRWRSFGLAVVCADMVGAMAGALAMAVDYAGQRRQFGRPIGSFQAIQHLCAEQHVSVEAARSATYYAAWAVDGPDPVAAAVAARVAKAYVGRVSRQVGEAVLQVYGGIGQTWECDAHRFLRRLLADRAVLGDEHRQEGELADHLLTRP